MLSYKYLNVLLFLVLIVFIGGQNINWDPCGSKTSCRECIRAQDCGWCSDPNFDSSRCSVVSESSTPTCREEYLWKPDNEYLVLEQTSNSSHDAEFFPHHLRLKLLPDQPFRIRFNVSHRIDPSNTIIIKDIASYSTSIKYFAKCADSNNVVTNTCENTEANKTTEFVAEITVKSCPINPVEWHETFYIYAVGLEGRMTVDLEMICQCPCENPGHKMFESNSAKCYYGGNYECGICNCDATHFGSSCECSTSDSLLIDPYACRPDHEATQECSGRGSCICGHCMCNRRKDPNEVTSGKYCECDNFSCDRHNQLLCSGPERGTCVCGQCVCQPGWTGSACDCRASNDTCKSGWTGRACENIFLHNQIMNNYYTVQNFIIKSMIE